MTNQRSRYLRRLMASRRRASLATRFDRYWKLGFIGLSEADRQRIADYYPEEVR